MASNYPGLVRRCWASSLGDCEGSLTREHIVSKGVLSVFNQSNTITITSIHKEEPYNVSVANATVRLLCAKHNSDLSKLDSAAIDFMKGLRQLLGAPGLGDPLFVKDEYGSKILKVNGNRLERWLAKTFINYVAAHWGLKKGSPHYWAAAPPSLVKYIFRNEPLEPKHGLYLAHYGYWSFSKELYENSFHSLSLGHKSLDGSWHYSIQNKKWNGPYTMPLYFTVQVAGLQLIGNFNVTMASNVDRDKMIEGTDGILESPDNPKLLIHRPLKTGFALGASDDEFSKKDVPPRIIEFCWG